MLIKCIQCAAQLKLNKMPDSGAVKCPKCGVVLKLAQKKRNPRPAKTSAAPASATPATKLPQPSRPQLQPPAQPLAIPMAQPSDVQSATTNPVEEGGGPGSAGDLDFLDMPDVPNQPAQSFAQPGGLPAYNAPKASLAATSEVPGKPPGSGILSAVNLKFLLVGVSIVVGLLLLAGGAVIVSRMLPTTSDAQPAVAATQVPSGFELVNISGVSIHMPMGQKLDKFPGPIEVQANVTPMGNVFMMAVASSSNQPLEKVKLGRRVRKLLVGGVLVGSTCERNGHSGQMGVLDQSIYFGKLHIEMFQNDSRIIVIGVSAGDNTDAFGMDLELEPEKQVVFYDSFKIGPKPAASFW